MVAGEVHNQGEHGAGLRSQDLPPLWWLLLTWTCNTAPALAHEWLGVEDEDNKVGDQ